MQPKSIDILLDTLKERKYNKEVITVRFPFGTERQVARLKSKFVSTFGTNLYVVPFEDMDKSHPVSLMESAPDNSLILVFEPVRTKPTVNFMDVGNKKWLFYSSCVLDTLDGFKYVVVKDRYSVADNQVFLLTTPKDTAIAIEEILK